LYSGDLRAHGRKASVFERLVRRPPADVDVLLLEGTNIRQEPVAAGLNERDVEERCVELFEATAGMALAAYSPQNIDRLVTLFRAAKRSGRLLVLDLYAASIARATGRDTIPQAEWEDVRVFVPLSQRIKVKEAGEFERVAWARPHRLYPEHLAARAGELVMTFRGTMSRELERAECLQGAAAVWSMWPGYLERSSGVRLRRWLDANEIPLHRIHSSGHAAVKDLQALAAAIGADQVVPIHTAAPERYRELFDRVAIHDDGDWWPV
jgi:ribonuclease J